jgi:hypothetical protein
LKLNSSLTSLNLAYTNLRPMGVLPIAAGLGVHPALTLLNLSHNGITSEGATHMGT